MEEGESNIASKEEFFNNIFQTVPLSSLREEFGPVKIRLHINSTTYRDIVWNGAYSFLNIEDIKAFIYTYFYQSERSESDQWLPKYTFLGFQKTEDDVTQYIAADYLWHDISQPITGGKKSKKDSLNTEQNIISLRNPYRSVESSKLDERFVDNTGNKKPLGITRRGRSTLEDVFHNNIPILHAFNLRSLISAFKGQRPISAANWNSRFAPYFPDVASEEQYNPTDEDTAFGKNIALYTLKRDSLLHQLDEYLESADLTALTFFGIRNLRLTWTPNEDSISSPQIEELFYSLKANGRRPFLRLLPAESGAISKLHTIGTIPIPDVTDPSLLIQWAREPTPTPTKDALIIKSLVRGPIGSVPAIYGTLRILEDGTADYILLPPRSIKKLDVASDLRNIAPVISQTITGTHLDTYDMRLGEISVIFSLKLQKSTAVINKSRIQQRLRALQPFFYEIAPLPNESPIIMLRYKAVSEFAKEDRISAFITQFASRRSTSSSTFLRDVTKAIIDEFHIDPQEVRRRLEEWTNKRDEFTSTAPETGEFVETHNPGIDVAIFGSHPFYSIHCYRINSAKSLARLNTLLSILLTADDEALDYFVKESLTAGLDGLTDAVEQERIDREEDGDADQDVIPMQPIDVEDFKGIMATEKRGTSFMDDLMFDDEEFGKNTGTVPSLLTATTVLPTVKKDAPTGVPAQDPAVSEAIKKGIPPPSDAAVQAKGYFITKLKEIDRQLFAFKTTVKGNNGYTRQCAANDDRQPAVLTHAQYMYMREVYAEDEDMFFVVYPFEGKEKEPPSSSEVYRILKYGSDPAKPSYYFCPTIFCLRCEIMIRPRDFKSRKDRDGEPKEKYSCPFCGGLKIDDDARDKKSKKYTVLVRKDKPKATVKHTEINFLPKASHPEGLGLPCCYTSAKSIRINDPKYAKFFAAFRDYAAETAAATVAISEKEETIEEEIEAASGKAVEYGVQLYRIHREYILGAEKHPIEPGKFGILTAGLDKYFVQDSSKIVARSGIRQELTPNAHGFLRMGVEYSKDSDEISMKPKTTYFAEGLLGVLVPLLVRNTIDEVRALLVKEFSPRMFVAANYGNLVLEFYNEHDPVPTENELRLWASRELDVSLLDRNITALQRIYVAYRRFIAFLNDNTTRKELRHISAVLAQPGFITSRGLILIILEHDIKTPEAAALPPKIRCPPYGISPDLYDVADVAFIIKDTQGIYTPLVYTDNTPAHGKYAEQHISTLRFQAPVRAAWPTIVQRRVDEFFKTCSTSSTTAAYTSSTLVNTASLAPISKIISTLKSVKSPVGIVRDSYNHIVGITYRAESGKGLVVFPTIDDGIMPVKIRIHLDWQDVVVASIDDIIDTYTAVFIPTFTYYRGYKPAYIVRQRSDGLYIGIQLENGMIIPGKPTDTLGTAAASMRVIDIDEFEWDVNRRIIMEGSTRELQQIPGLTATSKQLDEIYQYFRITVANWLAGGESSEIRTAIEGVIFRSDLPAYEKRKRLEILIGTIFMNWFYEDDEPFELPPTFLRSDCRSITAEDKCTGACKWVKGDGGEGQCRIHIPRSYSKTQDDQNIISTMELFRGRIIEELVQFYERRQQLMKNSVSRLSGLTGAVQYDDQWIIPERSVTWIELLRLDWSTGGEPIEGARFYEEKSSAPTTATIQKDEQLHTVPLSYAERIGISVDKLATIPYKIYIPDAAAVRTFMPIIGASIEELGLTTDAATFTSDSLRQFALMRKKTIILIKEDGTIQVGRGSLRPSDAYIFIEIDGGIGMLVYSLEQTAIKLGDLTGKVIDAIRTAPLVAASAAATAAKQVLAAPPTRRLTIVRK
jgi:hypothetical protein